MLVLAALWWAWGAYAWLTNYIAADEGQARLRHVRRDGRVGRVGARHAGGVRGRRAAVRARLCGRALAHIVLYLGEADDDVDAGRRSCAWLPHGTTGARVADRGALTDGTLQAALWIVALAIDYGGSARASACRLPRSSGALRGALLADRDHRARASRSWRSGSGPARPRRGHDRRGADRPGARVRALVGVLRRGRAVRRGPLPRGHGARLVRSRATPTATCTCR